MSATVASRSPGALRAADLRSEQDAVMSPVIIRAVDLLEGDEIFLAATGGWTRRLAEAAVARSAREAAALLAAARMQPDEAESPRLAEVSLHNGRPMPPVPTPPRPARAEAASRA